MPYLPHFSWGQHWRISNYRCGDLIKLRGDIHGQFGHLETKRRFSAKPLERLRDLAPTVSPWVSVIQLEHASLSALADQPFYHRLRQVFDVEQRESGVSSAEQRSDPVLHKAEQGKQRTVAGAIDSWRAKHGPCETTVHLG